MYAVIKSESGNTSFYQYQGTPYFGKNDYDSFGLGDHDVVVGTLESIDLPPDDLAKVVAEMSERFDEHITLIRKYTTMTQQGRIIASIKMARTLMNPTSRHLNFLVQAELNRHVI